MIRALRSSFRRYSNLCKKTLYFKLEKDISNVVLEHHSIWELNIGLVLIRSSRCGGASTLFSLATLALMIMKMMWSTLMIKFEL